MEPFRVHILGCGSALPTLNHHASSQVVEVREKLFMIDCGEGTQLQLRKNRIRFTKLQAVFISHLHGDHCFGLIGMISTFGMLGRTAPLHVYAHEALEPILKSQMEFFCNGLEFEVVFHSVDTLKHAVIYEDRSITVETIPLQHRIPTCGYLFREKPKQRHINREMVNCFEVPISQLNNLRAGMDWTTPEGKLIPNERVTTPPDPSRGRMPIAVIHVIFQRYISWLKVLTHFIMRALMQMIMLLVPNFIGIQQLAKQRWLRVKLMSVSCC